MIARPSAPVFGKFSLTKPSIVGQKQQTPRANTVADANNIPPVVSLIA